MRGDFADKLCSLLCLWAHKTVQIRKIITIFLVNHGVPTETLDLAAKSMIATQSKVYIKQYSLHETGSGYSCYL